MTQHEQAPSDIVLGAGVAGRALAQQLRASGRQVTLVNRSGGTFDGHAATACPAERLRGLPHNWTGRTRLFVCAAPAYHRWGQEFPALVQGIAHAVEGRAVDIIYLDNLYAYGPCTTPFIETSPYTPNSVKGRIRASAAEQLMALSGKGQVRVCIVRAASFFGPGVETSVVGKQALVGALTGGTVYLLGDPTQPHTLTYLPDAITALIRLAEEPMAYGHAWHVPNDCQGSVRELLAQVAQGSPKKMQERIAGRTMVRMIGLFNPLMREQREMMYMYEQAFRVSHAKTAKTFNLRATPVKQAIAESVAWARAQS